jgi:hypothetical protein
LKRAARFAGILVLLLILILTFDKTAFFFRLTGAALRSGQGGPGYFAAVAGCAYERPALLPLLGRQAAEPDFLAAWLAEHLRRGNADIKGSGPEALFEDAAAKFPDNIILDSLGAYKNGREGRVWQDLDALFFRLAGDPAFNSVSRPALVGASREGRLPAKVFGLVLSYLNWAGNPVLAENLKEEIGQGLGARAKAVAEHLPPPETDDARQGLARRLNLDPAQLAFGEDLIAGQGLADRSSFGRSWEFLDMSGRDPFAAGSFAGGFDPKAGSTFRIMGFYAGATTGRIPCRAGFGLRQALRLGPETYVFTFRYRTLGDAELPSFWLAAVEYLSERRLEPMAGEWRRTFFIFRNAELGIPEVKPLLRMWGTGTVWFADIGLYAVEEGGTNLPPAKETLLDE